MFRILWFLVAWGVAMYGWLCWSEATLNGTGDREKCCWVTARYLSDWAEDVLRWVDGDGPP